MFLDVFGKVKLLAIFFTTIVALEFPRYTVLILHMKFSVVLASEGFVTAWEVARKGRLSDMFSFMSVKVMEPFELLAAVLADVLNFFRFFLLLFGTFVSGQVLVQG